LTKAIHSLFVRIKQILIRLTGVVLTSNRVKPVTDTQRAILKFKCLSYTFEFHTEVVQTVNKQLRMINFW